MTVTIKDNYSGFYKQLFNDVVMRGGGGSYSIEEYKPFKSSPGCVNVATIVYNMMREMYEKNMQRFGKPLPSSNIKLSKEDTKVFLSKIRQFASQFDGQFIELSESMKNVLTLIDEKSQSQRQINGKPISEKPAEILPWTKELEVKFVSSKCFEPSIPTLIGRKFIKIRGKDSYENVMETIKIRI